MKARWMIDSDSDDEQACGPSCVSRRLFMTASGAATATLLLGDVFPGKVVGQDAGAKVEVTKLPRKQIAQLSKLVDGQPVSFNYPGTHMGGDLDGLYNVEHKVAGPCGEHLTTFDLTRHGLVVAGHATQALPQVVLEVEGDDIFGTGIVGLLYGAATNG